MTAASLSLGRGHGVPGIRLGSSGWAGGPKLKEEVAAHRTSLNTSVVEEQTCELRAARHGLTATHI